MVVSNICVEAYFGYNINDNYPKIDVKTFQIESFNREVRVMIKKLYGRRMKYQTYV